MMLPDVRPTWRGWFHTVTFFAAIPATVVLITIASGASGRTSAAVYAGSLLAVFGTSAAYHRFHWSPRERSIMQRLDHCMIYVLITGTYVPLCIVALPPAWGLPILSTVGVGALVGIVLKATGHPGLNVVASSLYPILGWAAVAATPALVDNLSTTEVVLIAAGGIAYTVGFPVLVRRRPNPWPTTFGYHEIWHACTVVAAVLHFAAVMSILT